MIVGGHVFPPRVRLAPVGALEEAVSALAWSPAGDVLAAGSLGGEVLLVRPAATRPVATFDVAAAVVAVAWSPAGDVLAVGAEDGSVVLWREGMPLLQAPVGATVDDLAWGADGLLAVGSGDRLLVLSALGLAVDGCTVPAGAAGAVRWDGGGRPIVAAGVGGVTEHPLPFGSEAPTLWEGAAVAALAWEPGRAAVAAGTMGGDVQLLFLGSGERAGVTTGRGPVDALAWSARSQLVAVAVDGALRTWSVDPDRRSLSAMPTLRGHDDWVTALDFSPCGPLLASVGLDGRLVLWDPRDTPDPLERVAVCGELSVLAWSHDGRSVAVGGPSGDVVLVDCSPMLGLDG